VQMIACKFICLIIPTCPQENILAQDNIVVFFETVGGFKKHQSFTTIDSSGVTRKGGGPPRVKSITVTVMSKKVVSYLRRK